MAVVINLLKKSMVFILVIVVPFLMLLNAEYKNATIMLSGGVVFSFFLFIEKFKKFKGGGIEAELHDVVEKAYATIEEMRELTSLLINHLQWSFNNSGRYGSFEFVETYHKVKELEVLSKKLGVEDKIDKKLIGEYINHIKYDLPQLIYQSMRKNFEDGTKIHSPISKIKTTRQGEPESPDKFRKVLEELGTTSGYYFDLVHDYEQFLKIGVVKEIDLWKRERLNNGK